MKVIDLHAFELQLCDIQGRFFELFADTKYDTESLVKAFMNGELGKNIDSKYNRMQWMGEEYLLEELTDTCKDKLKEKREDISKEVLYWIGYTYRYWHYYTGETSKQIYKQAPFKTMRINYLMFHTMDVTMAIDNLKEIFEQKKKRFNF